MHGLHCQCGKTRSTPRAGEAFKGAKIIHYSGDAKPWNFCHAKGRGHIPIRAMVEWCKMAKDVPTAACHMRGRVHEGGGMAL